LLAQKKSNKRKRHHPDSYRDCAAMHSPLYFRESFRSQVLPESALNAASHRFAPRASWTTTRHGLGLKPARYVELFPAVRVHHFCLWAVL